MPLPERLLEIRSVFFSREPKGERPFTGVEISRLSCIVEPDSKPDGEQQAILLISIHR